MATAFNEEGLATWIKVADSAGLEGLSSIDDLRESGYSDEEIARALNERSFVESKVVRDKLQGFHDSLAGVSPKLEFHHLVLILVRDFNHTISEAVAEIRANRSLVARLIEHWHYSERFKTVRKWLDHDRKSDKEIEAASKAWREHGPQDPMAVLIRERIKKQENKDAKKGMDERDAGIDNLGKVV